MHDLEPADGDVARLAIECARTLLVDVVYPLATRLGFKKGEDDRIAWDTISLEDLRTGELYPYLRPKRRGAPFGTAALLDGPEQPDEQLSDEDRPY